MTNHRQQADYHFVISGWHTKALRLQILTQELAEHPSNPENLGKKVKNTFKLRAFEEILDEMAELAINRRSLYTGIIANTLADAKEEAE